MFFAAAPSSDIAVLVAAVFLASAVEMVEALTIVARRRSHRRVAFGNPGIGRGARGPRRPRGGLRSRPSSHVPLDRSAPHGGRGAHSSSACSGCERRFCAPSGSRPNTTRTRSTKRRSADSKTVASTQERPRGLRHRLQGRLPRRPRGRHHGAHARNVRAASRARVARRRWRRWSWSEPSASSLRDKLLPSARERHEDDRRRDARQLRHFLDGRGSEGALAGQATACWSCWSAIYAAVTWLYVASFKAMTRRREAVT